MDPLAITAPNPGPLTLGGTNTYLIGGTVVDPGPDDERHLREVLAAGPVERIVLTHRHPDHASGAMRLSELAGAPVMAFGAGLSDGDEIGGLVAVHTPGHAPDHLCFWHPAGRALFSGDLIAGEGSIMIAPPEGDLREYVAPGRMHEGPNSRTRSSEHGSEVARAGEKIEEYLAHRREREARVVTALDQGARSLGEVVASAYADVPPPLRPYAELSARAHLLKLGRRLRP